MLRRIALALAVLGSGCLLEFDERLVQLEQLCARPGVIRCYGFDDPDDLELRLGGDPSGDAACDDEACSQYVTDERVSGPGALRFELASGSEGPPLFSLNFADDLSQQVGEGQDLYVQWRQRMNSDYLRQFPGLEGRTPTWLQAQIGDGDPEPGTEDQPSDMCSDLDVALGQDTRYMGPAMWVGCANQLPFEEPTDNSDILLQTGPDARCLYSDPTVPPCVGYTADRWTVYQIHVAAGTWQQPSTRVQMWMVDPGQGRRVVFDSENLAVPAAPGDTFGKIWLGPQMYYRDTGADYTSGFTWYDNLVISTEEIPDPEL